VGLTNRINKAFSQLEQEYEREPTAEELSLLLEISLDEIRNTLGMSSRHVSMDAPFLDGEENTLLDVMNNPNAEIADNGMAHVQSLSNEIERSLQTLTERQKDVIKLFFGIGIENPMSLEDIGERFDLTRERVRQIKDKAITKLRCTSRCKLLKNFLGN
jgi:RNA polymerase primary sigma factor